VIAPVSPQEIRKHDVISFNDPGDRSRRILHRVVEVIDNGTGRFFKTQGDANNAPDALLVPAQDVRGRLRWSVPKVGSLLRSLKPPMTYVVLVGPPALYLLAGELRGWRRKGAPVVEPPLIPIGAPVAPAEVVTLTRDQLGALDVISDILGRPLVIGEEIVLHIGWKGRDVRALGEVVRWTGPLPQAREARQHLHSVSGTED
jgi:hypothetical protein